MKQVDFAYWSEEEARAFLGYNETSMKNLRNSKALTRYQIGHRFFYKKEEISQLIEASKVGEINKEQLDRFVESMNNQISKTELKKIEKQFILEQAKLFLKRIDEDFLDKLHYRDEPFKRERYILINCIENNGDFESLAEKLNLSRERVKQIFEKASRRVFGRVGWGKREYDRIMLENKKLIEDNIVLKEQNNLLIGELNHLSSELKQLTILKESENISKSNLDIEQIYNLDLLKVLSKPIIELELSVRCITAFNREIVIYENGLPKYFKVKTLGDILKLYRNNKLLSIKNFGKGSYCEIQLMLEKYGLVDRYGKVKI